MPIALITGASRLKSIGAAVARQLAFDGYDIALSYWSGYDERMPWGNEPRDVSSIVEPVRASGRRCIAIEADLGVAQTPAELFDAVERDLGAVDAIVLSHCESVDSGILDTSIESFDLHFAVNARANWLMMREFALRYRGTIGRGRIVALTSDHVVHNMAYGASKGALDRITIAAAHELGHLGITANTINPGANDTGWMTDEQRASVAASTALRRVSQPGDVANLVSFLCSEAGGWITGQTLYSDGGASR